MKVKLLKAIATKFGISIPAGAVTTATRSGSRLNIDVPNSPLSIMIDDDFEGVEEEAASQEGQGNE